MAMAVSNLSYQLHGFEDSLVYLTERHEAHEISGVARAIQRYYLWIIAGVGVPANILAILCVLSLGRLLPPSLLVLVLSATDALTLLLKLIANQVSVHDPHMSRLTCRLEFVVISFSTLANWILVGVAVDRFLWLRRQRALRNNGGCGAQLQTSGETGHGGVADGGKFLLGKMFRKDAHGFVAFTTNGVACAVGLTAMLLMLIYGAVFFEMRDVDRTGRKCVVYNKYVRFWRDGWYWVNTALYFFVPFSVILVLTVICVRWLLLDKRRTSRAKRHGAAVDGAGDQGADDTTCQEQQTHGEAGPEMVSADNEKPQSGSNSAVEEKEAKLQVKEDEELNNEKTTEKPDLVAELHGGYQADVECDDPFQLRHQAVLTAMMVLAASFFLVLSLPGCVFYMSYRLKSDPVLKAKWILFEQVQYILVDMSHAINFFIYFVAVKTFRDSLIRLLTCKERRREK